MQTLLLGTYNSCKILQFDTGSSFLMKVYIMFYCQYVKFRNAAYEKIHLNLLQSFLKIKLIKGVFRPLIRFIFLKKL